MSNNLKSYNLSSFSFVIIGLIIIVSGLNSILYFLHPYTLNKITAIIWFLISIVWIWQFYYWKNNFAFATTSDKIIISNGRFRKMLEIKLSQIQSIVRKSPTRIIIWYEDMNGKLKKKRIYLFHINGNDQIEFNKYIEEINFKNISSAV
jgi:hypothetical protein